MAHYRLDTSKLEFKESWRIGGAVLALTTRLGMNMGGDKATQTDCEELTQLDFSELPADVAKALEPPIQEAKKCGLQLLLVHSAPTLDSADAAYELVYANTARTSLLIIIFSRVTQQVRTRFACCSRVSASLEIVDSSDKQLFSHPDDIDARYHGKASLSKVWTSHRKRVAGRRLQAYPSVISELLEYRRKENQASIERLKERGVLVPVESQISSVTPAPLERDQSEKQSEKQFWADSANKGQDVETSREDLVLESGIEQLTRAMSGAGLKLVSLICLGWLCFSIQYIGDWYHLKHHALKVTGQVAELDVHQGRNGKSYSMEWSYQIGGKAYAGEENITEAIYRWHKVGKDVALLVDEDRPSHSVLAAKSDLFDYAPGSLMNVFLSLACLVSLVERYYYKKNLSKLREKGSLVDGEIVSATEKKRSKGGNEMELFLRLQTKSGTVERRRYLKKLSRDLPSPGTKVQALYLSPKNFKLL